MIIILILRIYLGTKLNLQTKVGTLFDTLFNDIYFEIQKGKMGQNKFK